MRGITSVFLANFRNHKSLRLSISESNVVLCGQNGIGKTSVLEAISLFSSSKGGLRGASAQDILTYNSTDSMWSASLVVNTQNGEITVGTGAVNKCTSFSRQSIDNLEFRSTPDEELKKIHKINGQLAKGTSSFSKYFWSLWLTPQMGNLFIDGSESKRSFFDHIVSGIDPTYKQSYSQYKKTIRERLKILTSPKPDYSWVSALEDKISTEAEKITCSRLKFIEFFSCYMTKEISPFLTPDLSISDSKNDKEYYKEKFLNNRHIDAERKMTTIGPHRTEWIIRNIETNLPAELCSTGEQKSLLLSIILNTITIYRDKREGVPILLFDDLSAHLDAKKQSMLFESILSMNIQSFFTDTACININNQNTQIIELDLLSS